MSQGSAAEIISLTGVYRVDKHENMEAFVKAAGIPEDFAKNSLQLGTTTEIVEEGNTYSITISFGIKLTFTVNEEFEEPRMPGLKTIAKREGNTLSMTSTYPDGSTGARSYEFTNKGMIGIMTMRGVTAKRYYTKL